MADKPKPKPKSESPATVPQGAVARPAEPPKPVHIGGESFVDRILPHLKKIIVGILAAAVVLSVIFVIRWFRERQQVSETEKLDRVLQVAQAPIRGKDEKPDPAKPSYGNSKERAAAVLDAMAKNDTDVGGHAFRAGMLLDAGKLDEAIAEYKRGTADRTIEGVLCREGLGIALETKASAEKDPGARQKGLEEALAAFAAMQPEDSGQRRSYALYHQARIQLLLGKRADAKALFEKAKESNKGADREIADLIEKRLAALGAS
jgi:predicted negative regulator of RcsB-dependent stress response